MLLMEDGEASSMPARIGVSESGSEDTQADTHSQPPELKTVSDGPEKTSSDGSSEKEKRDTEPDMDSCHIVPNRIEELQLEDNLPFAGAEGHHVPRDSNSQLSSERTEIHELQPPETVNPDSIAEALSESALRSVKGIERSSASEAIQKRAEELNRLTQKQAEQREDIQRQLELSTAQLEEQSRIQEELKRELDAERKKRLKIEAQLMVLDEILPNMEEKLKNLSNQVLSLEGQLQEQVNMRSKLEDDLQQESEERVQYVAQQTRLHKDLAHKLDKEQDERLKSEADLMVLREMLSNAEEKLKDLHDQGESLVAQLQEQIQLRNGLEERLDWEGQERMHHMAKLEEHHQTHEELALTLEEERDERLKNETCLKEVRESLSNREEELMELRESLANKEEELKSQHDQVVSLTTQLQEQVEGKKELEEKLDQERDQRMPDAVMVSDHSSESLPVSSMPWSEEKLELAKLLEEHKTLLANQVLEAEKLKSAAQRKVGLLNHQVQNLEVLTDIAETLEHVFNAKERAIKQALWTVFQALCLGMGFMHFVVAYRDPLRSSLQPT